MREIFGEMNLLFIYLQPQTGNTEWLKGLPVEWIGSSVG